MTTKATNEPMTAAELRAACEQLLERVLARFPPAPSRLELRLVQEGQTPPQEISVLRTRGDALKLSRPNLTLVPPLDAA